MPAESERYSKKSGDHSDDASKAKRETSGPGVSAEQISFTLDVKSGRIVKLEALGASGERVQLSPEEMLRLTPPRGSTLEDVLERTFEAGISSVLDGEAIEEVEAETDDELKLRRLILRPMIERSAVGRLMKREVLGRAILGTLIRDAAASQSAKPKPAPASASASAPSPKAASPSRSTSSSSRRSPPRGRPH
jgi:hypothetical protein